MAAAMIASHLLEGDAEMLAEAARWAGRDGPIRIVEVGSYVGASAAVMLGAAPAGSHIDCIDIWGPSAQHVRDPRAATMLEEFTQNMAPFIGRGLLTPHRGPSYEKLIGLPRCHYHLAFVDGDHSYHGTLTDLTLMWPLLRVGGLLLVHDCIDDGSGDDAPHRAVRDFCEMRGLKYSVTQPPDAHYMAEVEKL